MSKLQKTLLVFVFLLFAFAIFSFAKSQIVSAQCVTNSPGNARATNGLISTQNQNISTSLFGNNTGNCVNNQQAALPTFALPTYAQLKSLYYDQAQTSATKDVTKNTPFVGTTDQSTINSWLTNNSVNYINGGLNINGSVSGNKTAVVFVDLDLNINTDLNYHPSDSGGGLVFVVQGDVNIAKSVINVDAVIISFGTICTAYDGGCPPPPLGYTDPQVTSPLNVNGSLIALNPNKPIIFRRKLINNRIAAEGVNQKPKYSVLLKTLFSQTLTLTTENTNYADQGPPPISFSCQPSKTTAYTGDTVNWTSSNPSGGSGGPYTFQWSGGGLNSTSQNTPTTYSSPGTYNSSLQVTDITGATQSKSCGSVTVSIPPISDSCSVSTNPATNPTAGNTNTTIFTWTAGNASGGQGFPYTYSWSGTGGLTGGNVQTVNQTYSSPGTQSATLTVKDKNNNPATINCSNTAQVYAPATVTCTPSTTTAYVNLTSVTWSATPSNGSGSFNYSWNSADGLTGSAQTSNPITYTSIGTKSATVTLVDRTTGQSIPNQACSPQVNVVTTPPLTASCSVSPSGGTTSTTFTWTANASGGIDNNYTYTWGGSVSGSAGPTTSTTSSTTARYFTTGTDSATITVTNSSGQTTGAVPCTKPTSVFSLACSVTPSSGSHGTQTFKWTATVSGGSGTGFIYNWAGSTSPLNTHTDNPANVIYPSSILSGATGQYSVTDSLGNSASLVCSTKPIVF